MNGLLIVALLGLGVYSLFLAGWASNSKFAQLGAIRAIAQTISYEIRLALIIFRIFISHTSLTPKDGTVQACKTSPDVTNTRTAIPRGR